MLAEQYETEGLSAGRTVAEWERALGLPRYSVYPDAAKATKPSDRGFFMYRIATDAERLDLEAAGGAAARARAPKPYDPVAAAAALQRRLTRDREQKRRRAAEKKAVAA